MRKTHWLILSLLMFSLASLTAHEEAQPKEEKSPASFSCSKENLLSFFPQPIVFQVFQEHDVPQEKWRAIYEELKKQDREIISRVEEKAGKMSPNPLKDLRHRAEAVKLFRDTLAESFRETMKKFGIEDPEQIQEMLEEIQIQKARAFAECLEQEIQQGSPE